MRTLGYLTFICISLLIVMLNGCSPKNVPSSGVADWSAYGRDPGGSRYAPLTQIDRNTVKRLKVAWTYHTGEAEAQKDTAIGDRASFEATPILIDDTLYLSTPFNRVIALDPETGAERWKYDPQIDTTIKYAEITSRGVSAWVDSDLTSTTTCPRRIFVTTLDARLIALDAATGQPCQTFGRSGQVDLTRDVRLVSRESYQVTSPPAVIRDFVVVGSAIGDNRGVEVEKGVVRAYDARTGELRWSWDPIPRQATLTGEWQGQSAKRTGAANAWSVISADPERGLVFVPTSSPSPDYYGGERRGNNRYSNSVVALRAATGEVVWDFQTVHHDLWDYDVPSQPMLITVKRDGQDIPAVAVGTKVGHLFLLDRETGKPLFPVEERPVPRSTISGEQPSPTQPFPTSPPALVPQTLTPEDAWGLTAIDRNQCRDRIKTLRSEGVFTPPSLEGTIVFPGTLGGMHWGGMAHDPKHNLLLVNTNRFAVVIKLIPRKEYDQLQTEAGGDRVKGEYARQEGTPYGMYREPLLSSIGFPCNPPPWGTLAAVDLTTGTVRWEVPLGNIPQLSWLPGLSKWGSINLGGSIVTEGDLAFIAAAATDNYLRAFDVETGKELWKGDLPASAQATPMTYRLRENGKQFVVIAAGGHGKLDTKRGDSVVAFALP